jgi:hypothetical protein
MIAVVVIMTIVAITVMAANDHDWSSMTAGISVAVSELNRYAALFCDHRWPIIPIRSGKRSTCQEEDCGSGKNYIFHRMLLRPVC